MNLNIPNYKNLDIKYLVLDYNGTIAKSGLPLDIKDYIREISKFLKIYVLSGNTFSNIKSHLEGYKLEIVITEDALSKEAFINSLDASKCIAIGNGNIDALMLAAAGLSIAVIGDEGCATAAILNSDFIVKDIMDAYEMILNPTKIIATLKR